jgi:large conductance mechanosensitive channel
MLQEDRQILRSAQWGLAAMPAPISFQGHASGLVAGRAPSPVPVHASSTRLCFDASSPPSRLGPGFKSAAAALVCDRDEMNGGNMLKDFRDFIVRGNVLDLAVAVIVGAAFATITASLTDDIIMPIVGAIFGGLDFSSHFVLLGPIPAHYAGSPTDYAALKKAGVAVLGWGQFLTVLINFLMLAFIIFLMVRAANRMMRRGEGPAAPTEIELLTEIRDELKRR